MFFGWCGEAESNSQKIHKKQIKSRLFLTKALQNCTMYGNVPEVTVCVSLRCHYICICRSGYS
ncbi:hypothetical protein BYT27DRAFT_7196364 [Phlegmacium glaucopus]|nr:hypothetical protein BYT27DRAFT_7196364 [Phlegmacium glaucopus]